MQPPRTVAPGVTRGSVVTRRTGNVDFAPTFAHIGQAVAPDFIDGRSLLPLLGAIPTPWREALPIEP